ncbi:hypothetical protein R6Q57_006314 [Mikania cordata]
MTLPEFGVLLGLYTKEEIDTDLYRLARHEDFDDVIASWWPQISDSPWLGKARVSTMRDLLHRYIHRVLAYTIVGRNQSQEWCTQTYLFYLHSILSPASCNLAWCMADTFASYESKRPGGYIYMGGYVTHLAQRLGVFDADVEAGMMAPAAAAAPQGRRLVFRDPVLRDQSRRLARLEDLATWQLEVLIAVATHLGVQIPALPPPRQYPDDAGAVDDAGGGGDDAGDDAGGGDEDADGGGGGGDAGDDAGVGGV